MLKKYYLLAVFVFTGWGIMAQHDFILHNFHAIPQNYMTNPAIEKPSKFVLGIPALSSTAVDINSNYLSANKIFTDDPLSDSLILDIDNVIANLRRNNFVSVNARDEIFFLGFTASKAFISLGISSQVESKVNLDKELLELVWYGNQSFMNETADFSQLDIYANAYLQYHLGFSYEVNPKLTVGTRFKYLAGLANLSFERFNASLTTLNDPSSAYVIESSADVLINASFFDSENIITEEGDVTEDKEFDVFDMLFRQKNSGVAFDFGAQYKGIDRFVFGASIINLGGIKWKSNVTNLSTTDANYTFSGVDVGNMSDDEDSNGFDRILDTLEDRFNFTESHNAYRSPLPTRFYLSGSYLLDEKSQVDLLYWGKNTSSNFESAISLGISRQFGNALGLKATYSIVSNTYANFGLGMSAKLGSVQLYIISDNIFSSLAPWYSRMANFRFGLNINARGRNKSKVPKESADEPEDLMSCR